MGNLVEYIKELKELGFSNEEIMEIVRKEESKSSKLAKKSSKKERTHETVVSEEKKTTGMSFVEPFRMDRNNNEVEKIYHAVKTARDRLYIIVSVYMAYRVSDTLTLTFGQLRNDVVKILEQKTKNTRKKPTAREMAVNTRVKQELETFKSCLDSEYCFPSPQNKNKPITRQQAHNIVCDAAEKIGLIKRAKPVNGQRKGNIISTKRYGTHSLRKAFGYYLHTTGTSLATIQMLYGHSSLEVTRAYLGIDGIQLNDVAKNIDFGF